MNKITLLGSGTSTGVPILSCKCKVCQSTEARNKRFRTCALIELSNKKNILIDASPDLRTQLLNNQIESIDAVIITHDHADHTHGIDDLRPFSQNRDTALKVFTSSHTKDQLMRKFSYIFDRENFFKDKNILGGGIPLLDLVTVSPGLDFILGEEFEFFLLPHGHETTLGIRHNKMAYIVDCRLIPDDIILKLRKAKLEVLIIDCLRMNPHPTHLHLDLTLEYIKRINPSKAILTHLGHEWDYLDLTQELIRRDAKNTSPAIDGQFLIYS
jgi:phosphoribosyl 1,2-cyclic phosphate phosphodiesterase